MRDRAKFLICLAAASLILPSLGQAAQLPRQLFGVKAFAELFRPGLISKIAQMDQNFIKTIAGNDVFYRDSKEVTCGNGETVPSGGKLFRISHASEFKQGIYDETRFYYGCGGGLVFRERFRLEGAQSPVHSSKDIFEGKMDFSSAPFAQGFSYSLSDGSGAPIFEFSSHHSKGISSAVFEVAGSKILKRQIKRVLGSLHARYYSGPFLIDFSHNGHSSKISSSGLFEHSLLAVVEPGNILYYGQEKQRISLAAFQGFFQLQWPHYFMDSLLSSLPKTKFVSSGLQNAKLLEELRNAQTFLISGTQLNLVRNLIEEYIKAAQEGSIVDRRD